MRGYSTTSFLRRFMRPMFGPIHGTSILPRILGPQAEYPCHNQFKQGTLAMHLRQGLGISPILSLRLVFKWTTDRDALLKGFKSS